MSAFVRALGLFTIAPVPPGPELTRTSASAALRRLPLVGAGLGAVAGLPVAAIVHWAPRGTVVAAVLAVALLAVLTRGLHLDGLADTSDGLGSRAPADRALEIMRRSDIGPFGVVTLVLVLLADVVCVAAVPGTWTPLAALTTAAATGRVAVLLAAHRSVPAARGSGFGAYVAGSVPTAVVAIWLVVALAGGALLAHATGESPWRWVLAQVIALALCVAFLAHVARRIGGVSGDVFGALVELGTALTLAGIVVAG